VRTATNVADGVRGDDDGVFREGPGDDNAWCELVARIPPHTEVPLAHPRVGGGD